MGVAIGARRIRPGMFLTAIVSIFVLALPLFAGAGADKDKDKDSNKLPRFTSTASLVLIPTVVTDAKGAHLTGLGKDDFEVLEDKQPKKIAIFEEIKTEPGKIREVKPTDNGFTNAASPEARNQRLTIILLDVLNTQFSDQVHARRELLKFLDDALQPGEPVAILAIRESGLSVINDFTTDPAVLKAAVQKVRGQQSTLEKSDDPTNIPSSLADSNLHGAPSTQRGIETALQNFTNEPFRRLNDMQLEYGLETTFRALRQVAESFAGIPGRKSLIWVTGGIPFVADDPSALRLYSNGNLLNLYESTWNALNHSQITVYPLDMGGLFNPGYVSPRFRTYVRQRRPGNTVSNLDSFAKMTGGRLCQYSLSLAGCFAVTQHDAQQYYLLGYYSDSKGKSGWRSLDVRVHSEKAQVRARTSYYANPKPRDPKKAEREDMEAAIVAPTEFTSVPMLVRWTGKSEDNAKVHLKFRFDVAQSGVSIDPSDGNLMSLEFAAFAKTATGGIAGDFIKEMEGRLPDNVAEEVSQHGVVYDGDISVAPGNYIVKFIVRDNVSGRMGTVSVPLVAGNAGNKN